MVSVLGWREARFREAAHHRWIWRDRSVPPPSHLSHDVDLFLGLSVPYPSFRPSGRNIGFVLRVGGFGGVERVAWNVAMQFAANGWSVHLFMVGADQVDLPDKFGETFSSINFLDHAMFGGFDDQQKYQGTALPRTGTNPAAVHRLVGALGWLDVVVNCHSGDLNGAAALLRRQGTLTATHLHILDHSPARRSVGHPILAVAYEHAYDLVLCCSQNLLAWIRAAGVPDDKLVLLPNAPGYPMTPAAVREVVARRTMPQAGQLHALFIGRLDRQKGIGRLADVIAETRRLALDIEWRIVGAPAFDSPPLPPLVQEMVEPPVYRAEQLTALYGWADVMVLLSDYEGVPLSILEAQRLGVVVISTDVGGVSEIIEQGASGFLVHPDTAVSDTVELLRWLAGSPGTVSAVAQAAVNVPDWSQSCAELLRRVSALLADRSGC
jgi:glycosyltransferase involved in cell wall biosynthesis